MNHSKIGFVSLGCPKNLVDTEVMLKRLDNAGYEIVGDETQADAIVINTCAFIQSAKEEAIESILDVAWLKKNRSLRGIVVCGCLAQRYADEIVKELPEVDAVVGVGSLGNIVDAVAYVLSGRRDAEGALVDVAPPESLALGGERVVTTPSYTAYLKIAEGCDNRCSYCAIPGIRGSFRSRPMEDVLREADELFSLGARELCLVAQDTTNYGADLYGKPSLARLLGELCKIDFKWIRLLYCYPERIDEELADVIAVNSSKVIYLDMPVQHISDPVLAAMNRRGGGDAVRRALALLRERAPGLTVRTTVMAGFPGERGEDFTALLDFLREARFDRLGAFAYSDEEGTPAASLPGKIRADRAGKRRDAIMELAMEQCAERNGATVGQTVEVLCEGWDGAAGVHYGRSCADAPDIDGKVYFTAPRRIPAGEFVRVSVTEAMEYDLVGKTV